MPGSPSRIDRLSPASTLGFFALAPFLLDRLAPILIALLLGFVPDAA